MFVIDPHLCNIIKKELIISVLIDTLHNVHIVFMQEIFDFLPNYSVERVY